MAAMAAVFLVMLLAVQVAFLVVARSSVEATVDSVARDAARNPDDLLLHEERLADRLAQVPGAVVEESDLRRLGNGVTARVVFRWVPPGPDLLPVTMVVERSRLVVVPP